MQNLELGNDVFSASVTCFLRSRIELFRRNVR